MAPQSRMFPGLYITGLGHQYPSNTLRQDQFENGVTKLVGKEGAQSPAFQTLFKANRNTGIASRSTYSDWVNSDLRKTPPPIDELSRTFRDVGVSLTVQACEKALAEARVQPSKITHTVGVTCSDTTNPGYDTFVAQRLKLNSNVEQTLLHGVGCAGGLAALRQAANLAVGASQRRRPAQILVFACELCSLFIHAEIFDAWKNGTVRIPAALFSDGAAALVVCNGLGLTENNKPVFELLDWATQRLPGTSCAMDMTVNAHGYLTTLTKEIPIHTIGAIPPMFNMLCDSFDASHKYNAPKEVRPAHCDWALHPGGAAILQGAQEALDLSADHLRASLDIYKSHGNSSSPTVLIVLDQLRRMGRGRDDVVATSFGPGLTIEMCMMRRCRGLKPEGPRKTVDLITKQRSLRLFSFSSWARLISIR